MVYKSGGSCSRRRRRSPKDCAEKYEANPYLEDDDECCDDDCAGCSLAGCCGVGYKSKKMAKRRVRRRGVQKRRRKSRGSSTSYTSFIKKFFRDNHRSGSKASATMKRAAAAWRKRR